MAGRTIGIIVFGIAMAAEIELPARLVGDRVSAATATAATPTQAEGRAIFYAVLKERTAAVEQNVYSKIEPLYAHEDGLVVFRPDRVMHGWSAVDAFWRQSLSRPRTEPFRVYWNDDLVVTVAEDLIIGGLTWSNQSGQNPRRYGCLSLVLRRYNDRWLIVHEHSSNWTKAPA